MLLYIYIYMCVLFVENTHKYMETHIPPISLKIYIYIHTHIFRGTVHPLYPHNIPMIPPFLLGIGHHSCWLNSNLFHGSIRWKIPQDRITISVARSHWIIMSLVATSCLESPCFVVKIPHEIHIFRGSIPWNPHRKPRSCRGLEQGLATSASNCLGRHDRQPQ